MFPRVTVELQRPSAVLLALFTAAIPPPAWLRVPIHTLRMTVSSQIVQPVSVLRVKYYTTGFVCQNVRLAASTTPTRSFTPLVEISCLQDRIG
jgi:hypothetical protein